jgi:hypothetical protein
MSKTLIITAALLYFCFSVSSLFWLGSDIHLNINKMVWIGIALFGLYEYFNFYRDTPMNIGLIYASRVEQKGKRILILIFSALMMSAPLLVSTQ